MVVAGDAARARFIIVGHATRARKSAQGGAPLTIVSVARRSRGGDSVAAAAVVVVWCTFLFWSTLCPLPTPTNRHKNLNSIALTRSNPNCVLLSLPVLLPAGCSSPISY